MLLAVSAGRRICQLRRWPTILLCQRRTLLCLAIETSCDDTSVALLETHEAGLSGQNSTQENHESPGKAATLHFHKTITADTSAHRGIHPIIALESHRTNLSSLISEALLALPDAHKNLPIHKWTVVHDAVRKRKQKPDLIAVTRGPGMRSNLACGLDTAKGFSIALQIPMMGVHHMQAHALTARMVWALENSITSNEDSLSNDSGGQVPVKQQPQPEFPFLSLLVSGGHTLLLESEALTKHKILATTQDTAIGEALDKIGRLVLPSEYDPLQEAPDTSFAKHLSNFAFPNETTYNEYRLALTRNHEMHKTPNKFGWSIQIPFAETKELKFSFSGIASRVHALYQKRMKVTAAGITREERLTFARTAVATAFEHLASRTLIALEGIRKRDAALEGLRSEVKTVKNLVVAGGVAASPFLRHVLRTNLDARGFSELELVFPPPKYCTDNAAMIGWAAIEMYKEGWRSDLGCLPLNKWSMGADHRGKSEIAVQYHPVRHSKAEAQWLEQDTSDAAISDMPEEDASGTSEAEISSISNSEISGTSDEDTTGTSETESGKKAEVKRMMDVEIEEEQRARGRVRSDMTRQTAA